MAKDYRVRRITNPEQYREAIAFLESVTGEESAEEVEVAHLVAELVSAFEAKAFPTKPVSPGEVLRFLMESNDLTQATLKDLVGIPQSTISEILADKRTPTVAQAARLGERFAVDPSLFMDQESVRVFASISEKMIQGVVNQLSSTISDEIAGRVSDEVLRRLNRA